MPAALRKPELDDAAWLRSRLEAGLTPRKIAEELGCGLTTVRNALYRFNLAGPDADRLREPPPERECVVLDERLAASPNGARVRTRAPVDVHESELERRLREGLHDLGVLVDLAGRTSKDQLWDLVVTEVGAADARAVCFAAALVAAEKRLSAVR